MQGISTSKHQHLVDALLQLEKLMIRDFKADADMQLAAEYRAELEVLFGSYNKQVMALAELIGEYHDLFNKAKLQFLSPKLKELKKQAGHDTRILLMLTQNIQLVYGT